MSRYPKERQPLADYWLHKKPGVVQVGTLSKFNPNRSRYMPHQSDREKARRVSRAS